MSHPTCPTCDTHLTGSDLRSGWCEACDRKIPEFVRAAAPAPDGGAPKAAGPSLWVVLGGAAVALMGMTLIALTMCAEPSSEPSRLRAMEAVGEQGTGVLYGLVLLGAGGFVALNRFEE